MIDKIVDAINEVLGGGDNSSTPEEPKNDGDTKGFVPDDGNSGHEQTGTKAHNLDQLVADAKKQIGDKPQ